MYPTARLDVCPHARTVNLGSSACSPCRRAITLYQALLPQLKSRRPSTVYPSNLISGDVRAESETPSTSGRLSAEVRRQSPRGMTRNNKTPCPYPAPFCLAVPPKYSCRSPPIRTTNTEADAHFPCSTSLYRDHEDVPVMTSRQAPTLCLVHPGLQETLALIAIQPPTFKEENYVDHRKIY